jgi:hypothetical protein
MKHVNNKSQYLKNNPNLRGIRDDYWTDDEVNEAKKRFNPKIINTNNNEYSLIVDGNKINIEYEEMVEILVALRTCELGNEAFIDAKLISEYMFEFLPFSEY